MGYEQVGTEQEGWMRAEADLMHRKQTGADYKIYIHAGADLMGYEQVGTEQEGWMRAGADLMHRKHD